MKRTVAILCTALLGLMLLTGCNEKGQSMSIGVVDESAAFKENKAAAAAMAYLQELGAPLQKEAETAYKAMQTEQTEENVKAYKDAMGKLQAVMNGEQQRVVALIDQEFSRVLEKFRAEKGLTVILSKQSVIASDNTIDITNEIMQAMDALEIDFTAPEAPAVEKSAAEEAEGEKKE